MKNLYFSAAFFGIFFHFCVASDYVPFVLWTNNVIRNEKCKQDVPVFPSENILQFTESDFFKCLQKTNPREIKIFITEELEESDFALLRIGKEQKAFSHLEDAISSSNSVVMPAVQSSSIVSSISATLQKAFKDVKISLVELPAVKRENIVDTKESLSHLDEMIQDEINKIQNSQEYIAVFTANSAPQRNRRSTDELHVGRHLLATKEPMGANITTVLQGDCVYIAYNDVKFQYMKDVYNLTAANMSSISCVNSTAKVDIKYKAVNGTGSGPQDVTLSLEFVNKTYPVSLDTWWNITSAVLTHALNNGTEVKYNLRISDRYSYSAPSNWSWVCESPEKMTWKGGKDNSETQQLEFKYLQMQPFGIINGSFSRALDCSGFLTGPIWMGTLISLLLALVFAFGMSFMYAITTMDRFDDPRGKGLPIHTHEHEEH